MYGSDPVHCRPPAPLSMEFPRQGYWSGLPFSSPGDLPDSGVEPMSPALAVRFFITDLPGKPKTMYVMSPYHLFCD